MNLLLDAHTLIWAVDNPSKRGSQALHALESSENSLLLSTGAIWEIAIKVGLRKLPLSQPFRQWMAQPIADLGLSVLPITVENADAVFDLYGIHHIW
ncbi:MAG: type II toxin-antitoxin system VapC family toxin [Pirellulales bacterium]|nr:type II toxin-antitoxin system VapC family toxin [Pirellulales bacterium]